MGYIYQGRKLCCDSCGNAGARKTRCPFGYCPSIALCSNCKSTKTIHTKAFHQKCEARNLKFQAKQAERIQLIQDGQAVVTAALSIKPDVVHVLFETSTGTIGRLVATHVYQARGNGNITLAALEVLSNEILPIASNSF